GAEEDCLTPEMMQLFRKGIQALQKEHDTPEISLTLQELLNASKNLEPTSPELIAALNEALSTAIKR
ncbi:hypothetical protein ACUNGV_25910, partial [Serratia sp. IR-2025]